MRYITTCIILIIILTLPLHANVIPYNEEINYKIAKNLFLKKQYNKAILIFNKVILENNFNNIYAKKSLLYLAFIDYKQKKLTPAKEKVSDFLRIYRKNPYLKYAYYLKIAIVCESFNKTYFKDKTVKKFKRSQEKNIKALRYFKEMKKHDTLDPIMKRTKRKIKNSIRKHEIYIAKYYLTSNIYIASINRMFIKEHFIPNKYYYNMLFIIIKSYNELFLSDISKKILELYKT